MVKNKVYTACPHTMDELKSAIKSTVHCIQTDKLRTSVDNFKVRLEAVFEFNGGDFETRVKTNIFLFFYFPCFVTNPKQYIVATFCISGFCTN